MSAEEGVAAAGSSSGGRALRGLLIGVAFAAGAALTAPAGALVSRMCWRPDLVTVPYGLAISAAGSTGVVWLARESSRHHGVVAAVAWLLGLAAVMRSTPGGGFLVAGDALGWAFVVVDSVCVIAALVWRGGGR